MGVTSEEHLLPFVERQLGVPAVRLREGLIDPLVISLLDRDVADSMHAIPLFRVHDKLCVALDEPQDLQKIDELERFVQAASIQAAHNITGNVLGSGQGADA